MTKSSSPASNESIGYTREEMLEFYESPICLLRPHNFNQLIRNAPEILRAAPTSILTASEAKFRLERLSLQDSPTPSS